MEKQLRDEDSARKIQETQKFRNSKEQLLAKITHYLDQLGSVLSEASETVRLQSSSLIHTRKLTPDFLQSDSLVSPQYVQSIC